MNIGIDARLVAKGRGLGEFAFQLISHLPHGTEHNFFIYAYKQADWSNVKLPPKTTIRVVPASYVLSEQLFLPYLLRHDRLDVYHATTNTAPLVLPSTVRLVLTIHDAMFLADKQRIPISASRYQRWGRRYYAKNSQHMIKRADAVTTISQFSMHDIADGLGIDPQKIMVIYEGVGEEFRRSPERQIKLTTEKYQIDGPFLLHLGAIDQRKQTLCLVKAFAKHSRITGEKRTLVITGINEMDAEQFRHQIAKLGLINKVLMVGFVSRRELVDLYSGAELFVFPSIYEGFGLPMLQAMACGCPVLSSDATSLPEIGGNAAHYFKGGDDESLATSLNELVSNEFKLAAMSRSGLQRYRQFDWNDTSREYVKLYERTS